MSRLLILSQALKPSRSRRRSIRKHLNHSRVLWTFHWGFFLSSLCLLYPITMPMPIIAMPSLSLLCLSLSSLCLSLSLLCLSLSSLCLSLCLSLSHHYAYAFLFAFLYPITMPMPIIAIPIPISKETLEPLQSTLRLWVFFPGLD